MRERRRPAHAKGPALEVVPFEPGHLLRLRPRAYERRFLGLIGDRDAYATALAVPGLSFTGLVDGAVLGCGGTYPLQRGVGEVWLALSEHFEIGVPDRGWVWIDRAARALLAAALEDGFHRLQTAIEVDFRPGHNWVRRLGFSEEGIMRKYGPDGKDYMRFARTA